MSVILIDPNLFVREHTRGAALGNPSDATLPKTKI